MEPKIAIILPAYNEELTVAATIADFHSVQPTAEIIVVDNRSADRTAEVAKSTFAKLGCNGRVLREPRPGKGNALRKAFREVDADVFVMADADTTYPAAELPKLLVPVLTGNADMVVGDRHAHSVYQNQNDRPMHNFGNGLVRKMINFLFRSQLSDIMSGYRVMNYRFVKNFPILSDGFEVETEMTLHAVGKKFAVVELPTKYLKRTEGSHSKLNTIGDGARVLKMIFWIFKDYHPLLFFSLLSTFTFLLGAAVGIPVVIEFMETGLVPKFPSAILASGLMVFSVVFLAIAFILDTVEKLARADYERQLTLHFASPFRPGTKEPRP